ncbi:CCR4-Not complex component, Not1-domain-containing protein [Pelagophyceae sp. CCMP2097]|nr:CCR4-Not complex component, Not1-domain-containing protein [Pelagophyceae sp. CCMP2097]
MHAALDRSASLVSTDGPEQERALGMGELMPAALDVVPSVAPTEVVLDCVHMVFNNVSSSNLDAKVKDIAPLLREENYGWFANYLVVKRISTQPNFHALYLAFLEKLGADEPKQLLLKAVIQAVFHNIAKLLRSGKITTSTSERSLLKNLGSWLGQITLARNRPILQRSLDVKELLYQGFESGRLIAICPFVAKILEGAKTSIVFRPPNPWLMGLMGVLRDLYDVDELKMNIKFEIEVLCKHLGVKLEDIAGAAHGLSRRLQPVKDRNPDFNVKRPAPSESLGGGAFGPPPPQAAPSSPPPLPPSLQQQMALGGPQPGMGAQGMGAQHAFAPRSGDAARPGEHAQQHPQQMQPRAAPAARAEAFGAPYSGDTQTVIPNLASYITVSAAAGVHGAALRRVAPVAVDRAIREIIQPVVERSVTIACITTKEIVAKDFATEPDEARARKAAQLMVANLAGSLALVTCKEPLRVSIAKHLRALLAATPELAAMDAAATAAVQTCAAENLDLGCMLIEKAATEKAIRDVDDALGPALHKGRLQHARALELMREGGPRFPAALPEPLRPRQPLLQQQLLVYEAFHRAPRGGQQPQPQAAPAAQPKASGQSSPTAAAAPGPAPRPAAAVPGPPRERRGGAAALSAVAQAGAAVLPSISIAELMELYRAATAKLDAEFVALARQPNAELLAFSQLRNHAVFRHVNELLLAAARVEKSSRDDAALAIAQSTFKAMCSKSALEPPVRLETLAIVLAASADTAPLVRDELANWIAFLPAHTDADRYLHAHVLVRLLGVELLGASELDAYLAHNMDSGRSQPWLEITLGFVELSVATYRLAAFPADFARVAAVLENVARQPQPQPALRRLVTRLNAAGAVAKQQQLQAQAAASASNEAMAAAANAAAADAHRAAQQQQPRAPGKAQQQQAADLQQYARRSGVSAHEPSAGGAQGEGDSPAAREQVTALVEQWIRVWNDSPGSEKAYATYVALLSQHAVPRDAQATEKFVRLATSVCVEACVSSAKAAPNYDGAAAGDDTELSYAVVDAYAKLLVLIVKYASSSDAAAAAGPKHSTDRRLDVLNRVLATLIRALVADYDSAANFDQRPYFRLFLNLLQDLNVPDPVMDSSNPRVLAAFATAFHALQPAMVPGFAFSWLELVSHRMFMPNLLLASDQKGWILMHRLLVDLFVFLEPYLRKVALSEAVRLLYKGALRVLLVLLHDFPEFLSDYHFSFCDVIPPSCIQLRNLFLSAFPRSMRLPDPFTPNLKVDLLPEISRPPRMLSNCAVALDASDLRAPLDEYLRTRHPISFLLDLPRKLRARPPATPDRDAYDVALVNALVVYVGTTAIAQLHANKSGASPPIAHSTPIDIFQHLMNNLDAEGRYFLLNAIANQLRYPNNHTHYFSCVLLYLFAEATSEYIQEQVTRVLLERLIVHRPHPWGLLITFIELIKNPRYSFWSHNFTHCATEIERVFESVARSCMGPGHAAAMQPEMPEA